MPLYCRQFAELADNLELSRPDAVSKLFASGRSRDSQAIQHRKVALHHHERFDGSGHPRGIAAGAIPLAARIAAVADSFNALTQARMYGKQRSVGAALDEILALGRTQFDPEVCKALMKVASNLQPQLSTVVGEVREKPEAPNQFVATNRIIVESTSKSHVA